MDVVELVKNATEEEVAVIATVVARMQNKPAVLVTLQESTRRRYVVAREDEDELRVLVGKSKAELAALHGQRFGFGGQWLRSMGRVDEMYRSLSLDGVVKVEEADRARVWGR
jgi:hypothetical protein